MITPTLRYIIEGGQELAAGQQKVVSVDREILLQDVFDLSDKDNHAKYYREEIGISKDDPSVHAEYLCGESDFGPVSVSIHMNNQEQTYVGLIRTSKGTKRSTVKFDDISTTWWRRWSGIGPSWWDIMMMMDPKLPLSKMTRVADPVISASLMNYEEQQRPKGFKFGLLYSKQGQMKEDEMFSNVETSPEFEEFLDFLGDRVPLQDWEKFRGGLDVKSGTTGTHSIYRVYNNNEIMFHVSTMLPFNPKDQQQLERKRHIGNDIVIMLFQDGDTSYKPTTISSRQVHVVIVVRPVRIAQDPSTVHYRLSVVSRDEVMPFGPDIPEDEIFKKDECFRDFLFSKLLNAERAVYEAPILENKLSRARTMMLKDIADKFNVA